MSDAFVVGEQALILGFKGAGFEVVPVENGEGLTRELARLARTPDVSLVLVTESAASEAPEAIENFREQSQAILTTIPTHRGTQHLGFNEMKKTVEYSIGVDMLGKD